MWQPNYIKEGMIQWRPRLFNTEYFSNDDNDNNNDNDDSDNGDNGDRSVIR